MNRSHATLPMEPHPAPTSAPVIFPLALVEPSVPDGSGPLTIFEVPLPKSKPVSPLARLKPLLQKLAGMQLIAGKDRRLRVSETVSLGEKRFVSLIEIDGVSLLIGGGSGNVQLLTQLDKRAPPRSFESEIESAWRSKESA